MSSQEHSCILVVDDEADLRQCIVELLEEEGFSVSQADNGKAALEYLNKAKAKPCLILLDYMMPVMDGQKFCEEQNKNPAINSIPVVLVTAATIQDEILKTMNIVDQVSKPLKIEDFLNTVKTYCKHQH